MAAFAVVLGACGSGTDETTAAPDTLAEGAGFVGLVATLLGDESAAPGKALGFPASSLRGKAAVMTACEAGGTVSHDAESGRTEYAQCATRFVQGSYALTTTLDGVESSAETGCPDAGCDDQTRYYLDQYGEGDAAMLTVVTDSNGEDVLSTALLTDRYAVTESAAGTTFDSVLEGVVTTQDRARGGPELLLNYQQTRFTETETASGYTLEINGPFATNAGLLASRCAIGTAVFQTTSPIEFDADGALLAGTLTIGLAGDRQVEAVVDNGQFVLSADGETISYSITQLEQLCR